MRGCIKGAETRVYYLFINTGSYTTVVYSFGSYTTATKTTPHSTEKKKNTDSYFVDKLM